jgi:peptidyl-prolyl cis-trans isomerase A (cyclophilin A)
MEPRRLLSATVVSPIDNQTVDPGTVLSSFDLTSHFADPAITGTLVQIQTTLGALTVALDDQQTPNTVTNFLQYAFSGEYNNTIFHQSLTQSGQRLVRGGAFTADGAHIPVLPPVGNEAQLSNVAGTIAADLDNPADPNSATSGFFFNTGDNSATLDPQHYTVFGQLVAGFNVLASINSLPTQNDVALNPAFTAVPVLSATAGIAPNNLVTLSSVTVIPSLTFTATSDNPALVQPSVSGTNMQFNYGSGLSGFAHVRVVATDVQGNQISQVIRVKVLPAATRAADVPLASGHSVTFVDANKSSGSISISGPGSAVVHMAGDALQVRGGRVRGSNQEVQGITVTGTTPATAITITGHPRRGRTLTIGDISADGPLSMIRVKKAEIIGDVTAGGTVRNILMDSAANGTITVGASARPMKLTAGNFTDENFSSGTPISSLVSGQWVNSDNVDEAFTSPFVDRLFSFGSFMPGLQLSGAGAAHKTLGHMTVGGFVGGAWNIHGPSAPLRMGGSATDWNATFDSLPSIVVTTLEGALTVPSLKSIRVLGTVRNASLNFTAPFAAGATDLGSLNVRGGIFSSAIQAVGNIGTISALELQGSLVTAGVGPLSGAVPLPTMASDFVAPAQIHSITLHPHGRGAIGFLGSDIAAATIGSLSLATTRVANGGSPFGVAAHTLGHLTAHDLTHKQNLVFANVIDPATVTQQVAARHLTLDDFAVRIL